MFKERLLVKEIFTSIQGEGPYVGQRHLFIRTTKCNLHCKYCDTDFSAGDDCKSYTAGELFSILSKEKADCIALTGGEPLLEVDFLYEFLRLYKHRLNKKIYLETNGTCFQALSKIIDYIDIVSADIKLKSATGASCDFNVFDKFMEIASKKETFAKVVFDKKITGEEIENTVNILKKYGVPLILQPKMPLDEDFDFNEVFEKFYAVYKNTRLIPQVHKFLSVR